MTVDRPLTICNTPDSIAAFRLLSLRGMLRLEGIGLKTRGGALRPRIAAEFGLRPTAKRETYIAVIETKLAEIRARQETTWQ